MTYSDLDVAPAKRQERPDFDTCSTAKENQSCPDSGPSTLTQANQYRRTTPRRVLRKRKTPQFEVLHRITTTLTVIVDDKISLNLGRNLSPNPENAVE